MDTRLSFASLLLLPVLAGAVLVPRSDFEDFAVPPVGDVDTLYRSETVFAPTGVTGAQTSRTALSVDGRGRLVGTTVRVSYTRPFAGTDSWTTRVVWDDQDRPLVQSMAYFDEWDSTFYTWNAALCPDVLWKNDKGVATRTTWQVVDGAGRCVEGIEETWFSALSMWNRTDSLVRTWDGSRLVQELELMPYSFLADTNEIRRIQYDGAGIPTGSRIWRSEDDAWRLIDSCASVVVGGMLARMTCIDLSDETDTTVTTLGTLPPVGIGARAARSPDLSVVRRGDGRVLLRNASEAPLQVDLRSTDGAGLGRHLVGAGETLLLPASRGPLLWRAEGPAGTSRGAVPSVR